MNLPPRTTLGTPSAVIEEGAQSLDEAAGDVAGAPVSVAPVCIAGMHRSGTSMVTSLLHACGLFLGGAEELAGPASDNPEGFWENLNFVRLNEELLACLGGRWDEPPTLPARWEFGSEVEPLLGRAAGLVARFGSHRYWGWKDPRNSLTIPFWRRVIPSLRVVVCVRNPLEVAHSLFVRGDSTAASRFELWLNYYRQILSASPSASRMVTHYQSYFEDARAEVRRVAAWLGLEVSDEAAERACAQVSGALRHHHGTTESLKATGASDEVVELYLRLCDEAGPIYRRLSERESAPGASHPPSPEGYVLQLMRMDSLLARSEARSEESLRLLGQQYANLEQQYANLEQQCAGLKAQLHEVHASLLPLIRTLDALRALRTRLRSLLGRKER